MKRLILVLGSIFLGMGFSAYAYEETGVVTCPTPSGIQRGISVNDPKNSKVSWEFNFDSVGSYNEIHLGPFDTLTPTGITIKDFAPYQSAICTYTLTTSGKPYTITAQANGMKDCTVDSATSAKCTYFGGCYLSDIPMVCG